MALFYNQPSRPPELKIFETLKGRMTLPPDSSTFYHSLQKGYEGEMRWHKTLQKFLSSESIVLYDLLLDRNDSLFQLDCIIIQQRTIKHLEVKNFEGDFVKNDNKFFMLPEKKEVSNPLIQINRGQRLMNELLKQQGYHFPIESYVVFVHTEFALYQLQREIPIILPTQINRFINKINQTHSKINTIHHKLAEKLLSLRTSRPLSNRLPKYEFNQLKNGIQCLNCRGWLAENKTGRKLICDLCGGIESRESSVLRNIEEFRTLFPDKKITTESIFVWCGGILSKYKIRKVLSQFLLPTGSRTNMHFISPFNDRS
ncbi:MAG TPA: nuclease-related domain-containing protein [Virgibacillus sp.]|nr:nuclease-related domain-containing protein [Virgibacillus sp.]